MKSNAKINRIAKHAAKHVRKTNAKHVANNAPVKKDHPVATPTVTNQAAKIVQSWVKATSEAIAAFDFELAAEYYAKLDWGWARLENRNTGEVGKKCPTADEIREEVVRMINVCIEGVMNEPKEFTCYHCSTGGLYVIAHKYPNPEDNWIWVGMTVVETLY